MTNRLKENPTQYDRAYNEKFMRLQRMLKVRMHLDEAIVELSKELLPLHKTIKRIKESDNEM